MRNATVTEKQADMTIGQLAHRLSVNVETIRFYVRIGLIAQPDKPLSGHRRYPEQTVARILFVQRAKKLGFCLKEIKELLAMDGDCCGDVRTRAENKRGEIGDQIRDLKSIAHALDRLIAGCRDSRDPDCCSLIEALSGQSAKDEPPKERNYFI